MIFDLGSVISAFLTILVLLYIVGDNTLFRFTIHLFIGVSAGFAGAVAVRNVVLPNLISPFLAYILGTPSTENILASLFPLVLSVILLAKMSKRLSRVGNVSMAYLVGIGAAVAIGGAVLGTVFPQANATANLLDMQTISDTLPLEEELFEVASRIIALVGTLATLIYFHFGARAEAESPAQRHQVIEGIGKVGQGFIAITFGVLFAGVFAAAITALIERVHFLGSLLRSLVSGFLT